MGYMSTAFAYLGCISLELSSLHGVSCAVGMPGKHFFCVVPSIGPSSSWTDSPLGTSSRNLLLKEM